VSLAHFSTVSDKVGVDEVPAVIEGTEKKVQFCNAVILRGLQDALDG
jgi:hypothetical protein